MEDKERDAILEAIKKAEEKEEYRQSEHYLKYVKDSVKGGEEIGENKTK